MITSQPIITHRSNEEDIIVANYLRFKVGELLKERDMNLHAAHLAAGFSYPTMHRYQRYPDQIASLHTPSIIALLVDALGWQPEDIEAMPFGHFFEVVTDGPRRPLDPLNLSIELLSRYWDDFMAIGDPILEILLQDGLDRLERLAERRGADYEVDDQEAYKIHLEILVKRLSLWNEAAPAAIRFDPELSELFVQLRGRAQELIEELDEAGSAD